MEVDVKVIKRAGLQDAAVVAKMAARLWDTHVDEELKALFCGLIASREAAVFLAYEAQRAAGFAQCQLRHDYVEGTHTSPVGYLEGIYVEEAFRRRGVALQLLKACENWARGLGCVEFASDCELENKESFGFHLGAGFSEKNRIICFSKEL